MLVPKVLLFDLGGVLVENRGSKELLSLLGGSLAPSEMRHRWLISPAVERFETGRCTREEFAASFIEEWQLTLEPEDFLARRTRQVGRPVAGSCPRWSCKIDRSGIPRRSPGGFQDAGCRARRRAS